MSISQIPIGSFLTFALPATACFIVMASTSIAQNYPAKPIRIIVGQTAGGVSDLIARMVAQRLAEAFKQSVVVENRLGAAGNIGTEMTVRAAPDGHTLLLSSAGPIVINPGLYARLSYEPIRDLAPIAFIASSPLVLVLHPSVPAKNVRELVALAKAQPDRLSYGSGGNGSPPHLTAELFKSMTGARMTHIPFKGSAPSVIALVGGQVDLSFSTVAVTLPQIKSGRIYALAVTSPQRHPAVPQLPTMNEAGMPGFDSQQWFALFGPAALPKDITTRLNTEVVRWLESPEVRTRLSTEGAEPGSLTLDQFGAFIRTDAARWMRVIKASGATAE
ncbi:MAG: tripartite tricarboxylate transporter substrate binding protein [Burkholderiales bacterium]